MSTSRSDSFGFIPRLGTSESRIAADVYRTLRVDITRIEESDSSTKSLTLSAKDLIEQFSARPESDRIFAFGEGKSGEERPSLKLDKVLSAMLTYSRGCGGEEGQRYVASTIAACRESEGPSGNETTAKQLTAWELARSVGITWVTHFLFVMRASEDGPHTATGIDACLIFRWPAPDPAFEGNPGSDLFVSAALAFEIMCSFTQIAAQNREELHGLIYNTPENAMTLEVRVIRAFNQFKWCMLPTGIPNGYSLKIYETWPSEGVPRQPKNGVCIIFSDHSRHLNPESRSIPLPSPHLIAINTAVAEILEESGARVFLNRLLGLYAEMADGSMLDMRYWARLEFMATMKDVFKAQIFPMPR